MPKTNPCRKKSLRGKSFAGIDLEKAYYTICLLFTKKGEKITRKALKQTDQRFEDYVSRKADEYRRKKAMR